MLVGFFKESSALACDARIIGFCDRIWADHDLSFTVYRKFSVSVDLSSKGKLDKLHLLVGPEIDSICSINDLAFDPKCYWNSPDLRTTAQYSVIRKPDTARGQTRGQIDDDKLLLDVFPDRDLKLSPRQVDGSWLLTVEFPEAISPGEKTQIRLRYRIPNALRPKDSSAPRREYICGLRYFSAASARSAVQLLGGDLCCVPVLCRPASFNDGAGFTIVLYGPPGCKRGDGFDEPTVEAIEFREPDGSESQVDRVKLLWQLDEVLERGGVDPGQLVLCSSSVHISGSLFEGDDGKQVEALQKGLIATQTNLSDAQDTIAALKREVRLGTIIAIAGTVVAVVGTILAIVGLVLDSK